MHSAKTLTIEEYFARASKKPIKHKYNAKRTEVDGIKFPSKLEASYFRKLTTLQAQGDIIFFLRQVSFDLPGKTRYVADYEVFWTNGDISFIDVKGRDTPMSILKRKQVEAIYPIKIEVVTKV